MLQAVEIQKIIEANLNCNFIKVNGDDGTHFDAVIVSDAFNGHSMIKHCLLYTSPSPRDLSTSRMPSSA